MSKQIRFSQKLFISIFALFIFTGCDSSPSQETMLKEQVSLLQNQVKGWQEHYLKLICLQDSLNSLESLDIALDNGLSLATYQQKIVAVDLVLESTGCADVEPLLRIMDLHHLAARVWEARNQGQAGDLAEDFMLKVYPLWRQFDYPWPDELSGELKQAFTEYEQASGPQAHQYLELLKNGLNSPQHLPTLAGIANQLLWHEAHNRLQEFKTILLTPPYPLQ